MRQDDDLIDAITARVEERLMRSSRMQSQYGSPLGPRTHRAAVNRRIERSEGGAHIVKGRFLLTQQALQEELNRETHASVASRKRPSGGAADSPSPRRDRRGRDKSPELDELQRELVRGVRNLGEVR